MDRETGATQIAAGSDPDTDDEGPDRAMKTWNTHAWYVTGFLVFLLICSIAFHWNSIPNLAGIISFALGLASLLLAVIAIIQSLTGGAEISAGLTTIRQIADDLREETSKVSGISGAIAERSDRMLQLISQNELKLNNGSSSNATDETSWLPPQLPLGGALAVYAASWSAETKIAFNMGDFIKDGLYVKAAFQDGFLAALIRLNIIDAEAANNQVVVRSMKSSPPEVRTRIRSFKYTGSIQQEFEQSLANIDAFFSR